MKKHLQLWPLVLIPFFLLSGCLSQDPKNMQVPAHLGVESGRLSELPDSPNAVSSQTDQSDKFVDPLSFRGSLEDSFNRILQVLEEIEEENEILVQTENYLHVVFTTSLMKFNDDVEFYFDADSQVIHFRSASRIGYSDLGKNKARYEEIARIYYED